MQFNSHTIFNRALKQLALQGHNIYMNIKAGMYLTNVRGQQGLLKEVFLRLRDGKITSEDLHGHGREKWMPCTIQV